MTIDAIKALIMARIVMSERRMRTFGMKRRAHYTASLSKNYEDTCEEMLLTMGSSFVCILDSSQFKYSRSVRIEED